VELFFKWIKQHLRIKAFYGTSENAVKTQIWIAYRSTCWWRSCANGWDGGQPVQFYRFSASRFLRKRPFYTSSGHDADANFAENVNQLILFDF